MKVTGTCPVGHIVERETNNPEQWLKYDYVKVWCDQCQRLVGVSFKQVVKK